ncbi:MAG: CocE/NonD family hydrolase [Thermoguttaceae bacterium]
MQRETMRRFVIGLAVVSWYVLPAAVAAREAAYDVEARAEVKIPMGDGVRLSANIFLPKGEGRFPVLLTRTPYGKGNVKSPEARFFASRGYVFVNQDCRGRGTSEGEWLPFLNEAADGADTRRWILAQSWSNGRIGTTGGSYVGFTQWASAPGAGDSLQAMFPIVPLVDPHGDVTYVGGSLQLALTMGWGTMVSKKAAVGPWVTMNWPKAFRTLPLCTWDTAIGGKVQYLRDWVAHPQFDEYWRNGSVRGRLGEVTVPIYAVGGWYDIFSKSVLEHVNTVRKTSRSQNARRNQHVLMGPWVHGIGRDGKIGEFDFGKGSAVDINALQVKWFDHWLKDQPTGVEGWAPLRIFVMGRNQWRDEQEWPLARTQYTRYYFHSAKSANSLKGDGLLITTKPSSSAEKSSDRFVYDPNDPVPTLGGCNLFGCPAGPHDQRKAEERADVLVFTGDALTSPLEVTGPVKVVLDAASSATDTDWTAKLVDVHPDGRSFNLCDGILRARYRDQSSAGGSDGSLTLIEPGKVYRYEIDLWVTSNVFLPGHKIRVEISSSNFPRFDRNPNTGHPFGADAELNKATQTVYHDAQYPSHILLPLIPCR